MSVTECQVFFGLKFELNIKSVMSRILDDVPPQCNGLYWAVICVVKSKIWKTRATMGIHQCSILTETVFRNDGTHLQRLSTEEEKKNWGNKTKNEQTNLWTSL